MTVVDVVVVAGLADVRRAGGHLAVLPDAVIEPFPSGKSNPLTAVRALA